MQTPSRITCVTDYQVSGEPHLSRHRSILYCYIFRVLLVCLSLSTGKSISTSGYIFMHAKDRRTATCKAGIKGVWCTHMCARARHSLGISWWIFESAVVLRGHACVRTWEANIERRDWTCTLSTAPSPKLLADGPCTSIYIDPSSLLTLAVHT